MSGFGTSNANGPATIGINGGALGTELTNLLLTNDLVPGAEPSYQICRTVFL